MIGLTRQFREKDNDEYFIIPISVSTAPTTYTCGFEIADKNRGGIKDNGVNTGRFEVDWGDGTTASQVDWSPFINHVYGATGSYNIKVYCREPKNTLSGFGFSAPSNVSFGNLDFSDYHYMYKWQFPAGSSFSITFPTQFKLNVANNVTTFSFRVGSGTYTINGLTDGILDLRQWASFDTLYSLTSGSSNYDRICVNSSNIDTSSQFYYSTPLVAFGPSASDLNNWDADFRGQNLSSQFRYTGTGLTGATGNTKNIIFGTNSFGNLAGREILITNTGISELDISGVSWGTLDNKEISIYSNPLLQTITISSTSSIFNGTFYRFQFFINNLTGHLNMIGPTLSNTTGNLITGYSNPNLTQVTMPLGRTDAKIQTFHFYNCGLTAVNGFSAFTQSANINSANYRLDGNFLSVEQVNKFLVDVDNSSTSGFTSRAINLSGVNNGIPDDVTGFSGSTAKASLISKGFTVTTNT